MSGTRIFSYHFVLIVHPTFAVVVFKYHIGLLVTFLGYGIKKLSRKYRSYFVSL